MQQHDNDASELKLKMSDIWTLVLLIGVFIGFLAASSAKDTTQLITRCIFMLFCLWMLIFKPYKKVKNNG